MQSAVPDGKIGSGGNNVQVVGFDRHSIRCLPHSHRRVACQQVHHHTFMGWIEMLDQDESHAVVAWQRAYELPAGLEATR